MYASQLNYLQCMQSIILSVLAHPQPARFGKMHNSERDCFCDYAQLRMRRTIKNTELSDHKTLRAMRLSVARALHNDAGPDYSLCCEQVKSVELGRMFSLSMLSRSHTFFRRRLFFY